MVTVDPESQQFFGDDDLTKIFDNAGALRKEQGTTTLLTQHHRPDRHLGLCLFLLGRVPDQQHSISNEATEKIWPGSLRSTVQKWTNVNSDR